ncbi:MAG: ATP synthase F0 subunit B [Eubacteriales bacterium]|jgi:F-type H+-transporting ATPase subunit b
MLDINISLVFTIIDVLILYFILKKFFFGKIRDVMNRRKEEIDSSYQAADQKMKEADALKAQYEQTLASIDQKKEESIASARKDASAEYDRIVADANTRSEEILAETRKKADSLAARSKQKADDEISAMVKNAAAKLAESQSDKSLYDAFLKQTETSDPDQENA